MIIAIDGNSGSGKGTVAKYLANKFSLFHIDTGLIYRAVAYRALVENLDFSTEDTMIELLGLLEESDFDLPCLRDEEIGNMASKIAVHPSFRKKVTEYVLHLIKIASPSFQGVVIDGRDIGSVVCPDAEIKFHLTADPAVRAERRLKEKKHSLDNKNSNMIKNLKERDDRDKNRSASPLVMVDGALLINTSKLSIEEVNQKVDEYVKPFFST